MTIRELLRANPRASMPIEIGADQATVDLDWGIVGFLEQVRKRLG
jgi:hypothetical protein